MSTLPFNVHLALSFISPSPLSFACFLWVSRLRFISPTTGFIRHTAQRRQKIVISRRGNPSIFAWASERTATKKNDSFSKSNELKDFISEGRKETITGSFQPFTLFSTTAKHDPFESRMMETANTYGSNVTAMRDRFWRMNGTSLEGTYIDLDNAIAANACPETATCLAYLVARDNRLQLYRLGPTVIPCNLFSPFVS